MTDNLSDALETEAVETASSSPDFSLSSRQSFLIGLFVGALMSFVGLSISMEMTGTAIADVSWVQWVGAITFPCLLGILSTVFRDPFVDALFAIMRVLPY